MIRNRAKQPLIQMQTLTTLRCTGRINGELRVAMDSPGAIPRGVTNTGVGLRTGTAVGTRGGATFSDGTFSLSSSLFSGSDAVESCESVCSLQVSVTVFNPPELLSYRSAGLFQRRVVLCRRSLGSHYCSHSHSAVS